MKYKEVKLFRLDYEDLTGDKIMKFSNLKTLPVLLNFNMEKPIGIAKNIHINNKYLIADIKIKPEINTSLLTTCCPAIKVKNSKIIGEEKAIRVIEDCDLIGFSVGIMIVHTQPELDKNLIGKSIK
jgi:hypothetical protein